MKPDKCGRCENTSFTKKNSTHVAHRAFNSLEVFSLIHSCDSCGEEYIDSNDWDVAVDKAYGSTLRKRLSVLLENVDEFEVETTLGLDAGEISNAMESTNCSDPITKTLAVVAAYLFILRYNSSSKLTAWETLYRNFLDDVGEEERYLNMAWDRTFPFVDGEMLSWDSGSDSQVKYLTLDEASFTGTLKYLSYSRGRSSAMLVFTDGTKHPPAYKDQPERLRCFYFFMTDSDKIIPMLISGELAATFVPTKRGQNFGWKVKDGLKICKDGEIGRR